MEKDLISIILPIYNMENYIEICLNSILKQTYKNLEIICVNDGSNDRTLDILDKYKNIKVISKNNSGVADTRNLGIVNSNGKYIAFIDPDDYIEHDYIEKLYLAIIENDSDISKCCYKKINGDKVNSTKGYKGEISPVLFAKDILTYNGKRGTPSVWAKMFKRTFVMSNNIRYKKVIGEDGIFILDCLAYNPKITSIKNTNYMYNTRIGSAVNSFNTNKLLDSIEYRNYMIESLQKIDYNYNKFIISFTLLQVFNWTIRIAKFSSKNEYKKNMKYFFDLYKNELGFGKFKILTSTIFSLKIKFLKHKLPIFLSIFSKSLFKVFVKLFVKR